MTDNEIQKLQNGTTPVQVFRVSGLVDSLEATKLEIGGIHFCRRVYGIGLRGLTLSYDENPRLAPQM